MKYNFCVLLLITCVVFSQDNTPEFLEAVAYQEHENKTFADPETSILTPQDLKEFKQLDFYPVDLKYRVIASFKATPDELPFLMPTTSDRTPEYVKYGEAHFELDGEQLSLNLYQSVPPMIALEYIDYLFLPFTDLTSGDGSYGGGRFLDTRIPDGDTMVLDFNKAYNPYCAYNTSYSCPIPPRENDVLVRINAGVKEFKH
jgi:uncharacterized protein (DUF1684 family)